ncbi:protein Daple isoform X2 [Heptranchias perlo]|uniref:protein Daple isoform X2 n=1 Tax=Heptranchias perlo TaxID=212740 RepID=UPI0035598D37
MLTMDVTISELMEQFLESPLVTWVKTFGPLGGTSDEKVSMYMDLVDGMFLHKIMLQMDPRPTNQRVNKHVNNDAHLRVQNLTILVRHIKNYYQECLQQLVVMSLPNVLMIAKDPLSGKSMDEMKKVLLLMLGCAVQCERKEEFIERIKQLDIATQTAIVAHIQEITHNQENVFDLQWMEQTEGTAEDLETLSRSMVFHLKRLLDDRDEYSEAIVELTQERDYLQCQQQLPSPVKASSPDYPSSPNGKLSKEDKQHLAVDLADTKAKLRRIRQELEEKAEQLIDSKHEVERLDLELQRLRQENMQLATDVRSVRAYRDELDSLREKASRVDRLENELIRCRERLHDVDFYKARMEELREDNIVLIETKTMLEEQLIISRARCDKLHELEKENLQLKSKLQDLEMDREADRKRIEELLEENMVLEIEKKQSMNESAHLGWELEQLSKSTDLLDASRKSFVFEMNESASSRILKLEKENQSLQHTVQELQQASLSAEESHVRIVELGKENELLSIKVEKLQSQLDQEKQSNQDMGSLSEELLQEKAQLKESVETLRAEKERQVKELEQENEHLSQTVSSLRERSQINAEARVKDIEKENKILHETITETSGKLAKLEFEKKRAHKELLRYKEKEEKAKELEKDVHRLEQDNEQLHKRVASLKITCENVGALEQENSNLDLENSKLKKSLNSLQNVSIKLETVEKDNKQLDEENLELRRMVETLKFTRTKLIKVEMENRELEKEKDELRNNVELLRALNRKSERLEVSYQSLDSENQRLQQALDNSNTKIQQLEKELQDTENENHILQKNLEELKISSKRLEKLEKDNKVLEHETAQLEKDKKTLDKDNKRLWQQVELKDAILDENSLKLSSLEKEKRTLEKEMGKYKETTSKVKELEVDNKELFKQATIDKRTLATLREELVHEKLKSQQLSNELEKLNQELEKIGLTKERLLQDEHNSDDNKYKILETKIESTLKKTLEIREEKIHALESRLVESSSLNHQLRVELSTVKWNLEALLQRQEEEKLLPTSLPNSHQRSQADNTEKEKWEKESRQTTLELLKVKDNIIEVERNNAALQAEKELLRDQLKQLEAQNSVVNSQIVALQRQTASMQEHSTALQIQNAKLQVENSTLNSQGASLMGQNALLQNQQSALENEKENLTRQKEDLKATHDSLLQDHERLMVLHERQSSECETLISQQAGCKASYKSLESQHKDLEERYVSLLKQRAELEELDSALRTERENLQRETNRNAVISEDKRQLEADLNRLSSMNAQLKKEYDELQTNTKEFKSALNATELELARWQAQYHELKEQHQNLDISHTKLDNHCELLTQLKGNLEEENHYLLSQVQLLSQQNQTLLERSMESKEHYHEEQKQYIDKLNSLRRQKEKLEEKIMDQYKFYEPTPKRKNNWVAAKALVKLMKPKKEGAKERLKSTPEGQVRQPEPLDVAPVPTPPLPSRAQRASLDNSSQGSNSLEENSLSPTNKVASNGQRPRELPGSAGRSESACPSPEGASAAQRRRMELGSMAYSTSAIHLATSSSTPTFSYRRQVRTKGFNSDDDLRTQTLEVESPSNGNGSLGATVPSDSRPQSLSSDDLVPSRDVGAGPKENYLYRSSSVFLANSNVEPLISRRSPGSYSTLQRVKESQAPSRTRPSSPGSEMVTLEEFLQESGQSPTSVSIRDDMLSDYFKKKSEPSMIREQPNRKEGTKMPTSYVSPTTKTTFDSGDGRVSKPGQYVKPNPRPSAVQAQPSCPASPWLTVPSHGNIPNTSKQTEKTAQPQHPPAGNTRNCALTRAFSLASADVLRANGPDGYRQETQHKSATDSPLSRDNGKSSWKSTGDCRSSGSQPAPRERPQSARVLGSSPIADISCRTLDPRRLSLAPPKDEKTLTVLQHSASLGNGRGLGSSPSNSNAQLDRLAAPNPHPHQHQHHPSALPSTERTAQSKPLPRCGEVALVSPVRPVSYPSEEQKGRSHRPCEASNASPQSRSPEYINAMTGMEDSSKGNTNGQKSSPTSPDPSGEQQTVWYEYGCV